MACAGRCRRISAAPAGHAQSGRADGSRHRDVSGHAGVRGTWDHTAAGRGCRPAHRRGPNVRDVMPKLDGVLETALYVDDLDRAVRFYTGVLELRPLYQDSRMSAFS